MSLGSAILDGTSEGEMEAGAGQACSWHQPLSALPSPLLAAPSRQTHPKRSWTGCSGAPCVSPAQQSIPSSGQVGWS